MRDRPGTVPGVQGGRGNRWVRPLLAGIAAFLLLLAALYSLDRAGSYITGEDAFGAGAISLLVAAIVGAVDS